MADDASEALDAVRGESDPVEPGRGGDGEFRNVDVDVRAVIPWEEEDEADERCEVDDRDDVADFEFHVMVPYDVC